MRILFITPYPTGEAPSQRFRFEQYLPVLAAKGISYRISSFLGMSAWKILYRRGYILKKVGALLEGYLRRLRDLLTIARYDVVFIHREASPFGPPLFVWIITHIFRKRTIYDFDDAIWIPNASESNGKLTMLFKRFDNPKDICRWVNVVSVGNQYLADFASEFNRNVVINPTTIDTDLHHNITTEHANHIFTIGWTGSHSTVRYLQDLVPVLKRLSEKYTFELDVICDVAPDFELPNLKFIRWSKEKEISDLLNFNVGIMPLPEDVWAKGKCGFKALQYLALGIPAIVSAVGVNAEIVDHGINGFVCRSSEDWFTYLEMLILHPSKLREMSARTRDKIINHYSVKSNSPVFLSLFDQSKKN